MTEGPKFTDIQILDPQRRKEVDVRVTYDLSSAPTHGLLPIVILSHGAGGTADTYQYLVKHWASQGFVVFQPSHYDSLSVLRRQRPRVSFLQTMKAMPSQPEKWIDRVRDVSCIPDELQQVRDYIPQLSDKLDDKRIAVAGHSYGAFTAQLIAGVVPPRPYEGKSLRDDRVKAIIAISAQGVKRSPEKFGFDDRADWQHLTIPAMFLTGDRDVSIFNGVEQRLEGFNNSPQGGKYAVVLNGANHMTFTGNELAVSKTNGAMQSIYQRFESDMPEAYGDRTAHLEDIKTCTTLFLRAYLLGNALSSLSESDLRLALNGRAHVEIR